MSGRGGLWELDVCSCFELLSIYLICERSRGEFLVWSFSYSVSNLRELSLFRASYEEDIFIQQYKQIIKEQVIRIMTKILLHYHPNQLTTNIHYSHNQQTPMLKKIILTNILAITRPFLFSTSKPNQNLGGQQADYAMRRKTAIDTYNLHISHEKTIYNQNYSRLQKSRAAVENEKQRESLQQKFRQYLDVYYSRIRGLSAQLKKELDQIEQQQKTEIVKTYLLDNLPNDKEAVSDRGGKNKSMYIPNRLILKKIYHGTRQKAKQLHRSRQILLAGVENQEDHSLFLTKLIDEMEIKNVVTMVSPDLPYFIKTEKSYLQEWSKFIQNNEYAKKCKFYLNPQPATLQDICLHEHHIPLVRNALSRSRTFLQNYYCLMKENDISKKYQPAPLFTGLTSQTIKRIYFANYPAFQERRMIADHTPLPKLRQLFQLHLRNYRLGKLHFSAQWLFPKEVLSKKLAHLISVTRAVVESTNQRTMLICSAEIADLLSIEWQLSKQKLNYNYQDRNYYLNVNSKVEGAQDQSFMDFIEKLVILDLITEPIFTRYFVKYRSFPFLCEHTIGGKQNIGKIFAVWMHFYNTYYSLLTEKRLQKDGSVASQKKEYINQFENPTNFT